MDEIIFSGYCRCQDASRMVTAEWEQDRWFVDCNYPDCPYSSNCEIAKKLSELQNQ